MTKITLQTAKAEHAKWMPSRTTVGTSIAAGLRLPPFPPGTTVRVGRYFSEGGDIPVQYPRLRSSQAYVHTVYGWTVVDRADLVAI